MIIAPLSSPRRSDLAREIYPKTRQGLEAPNEEREQQDDRETGWIFIWRAAFLKILQLPSILSEIILGVVE